MKHKIILALLTTLLTSNAMACKVRRELETYPEHEIKEASILIEAKIDSVENNKSGRPRYTKSFTATVLNTYKGEVPVGKVISVAAAIEEAQAVCPINMQAGETYLLLLNKNSENLEMSRFSYLVDSSNEKYAAYKQQIKAITRK